MALNLVNQVGERNPQLFREIKGRLKPRNILIAVTLSLLGQLLVLMSFSAQLPIVERVLRGCLIAIAQVTSHLLIPPPTAASIALAVLKLTGSYGGKTYSWR
jgi:hypothetical protein